MNIKYLKDAPQGKTGDVVEIDSLYGGVLIATGYAEEVEDKPEPKTATKKTTTKKTTAK